jgi:tRNA-splicing ligase RtcB
MQTGSYLLAGTAGGRETFFSTAHGSGRSMSRHEAKRRFSGRKLEHDMEERGICVRTACHAGLAEEAGAAYKDIDLVVGATEQAGISRRVARLIPIGNVKG